MSEYSIILNGPDSPTEEANERLRRGLQEELSFSSNQIDELLANLPAVLERGVARSSAEDLVEKLRSLGADAKVVGPDMVEISGSTAKPAEESENGSAQETLVVEDLNLVMQDALGGIEITDDTLGTEKRSSGENSTAEAGQSDNRTDEIEALILNSNQARADSLGASDIYSVIEASIKDDLENNEEFSPSTKADEPSEQLPGASAEQEELEEQIVKDYSSETNSASEQKPESAEDVSVNQLTEILDHEITELQHESEDEQDPEERLFKELDFSDSSEQLDAQEELRQEALPGEELKQEALPGEELELSSADTESRESAPAEDSLPEVNNEKEEVDTEQGLSLGFDENESNGQIASSEAPTEEAAAESKEYSDPLDLRFGDEKDSSDPLELRFGDAQNEQDENSAQDAAEESVKDAAEKSNTAEVQESSDPLELTFGDAQNEQDENSAQDAAEESVKDAAEKSNTAEVQESSDPLELTFGDAQNEQDENSAQDAAEESVKDAAEKSDTADEQKSSDPLELRFGDAQNKEEESSAENDAAEQSREVEEPVAESTEEQKSTDPLELRFGDGGSMEQNEEPKDSAAAEQTDSAESEAEIQSLDLSFNEPEPKEADAQGPDLQTEQSSLTEGEEVPEFSYDLPEESSQEAGDEKKDSGEGDEDFPESPLFPSDGGDGGWDDISTKAFAKKEGAKKESEESKDKAEGNEDGELSGETDAEPGIQAVYDEDEDEEQKARREKRERQKIYIVLAVFVVFILGGGVFLFITASAGPDYADTSSSSELAKKLVAARKNRQKRMARRAAKKTTKSEIAKLTGTSKEGPINSKFELHVEDSKITRLIIDASADKPEPISDEDFVKGLNRPWLIRYTADLRDPTIDPDTKEIVFEGKGRAYLETDSIRERVFIQTKVRLKSPNPDGEYEGSWSLFRGKVPEDSEAPLFIERKGLKKYNLRLTNSFTVSP